MITPSPPGTIANKTATDGALTRFVFRCEKRSRRELDVEYPTLVPPSEQVDRVCIPGVAEFRDLSYVKPNILGNTRMLLML